MCCCNRLLFYTIIKPSPPEAAEARCRVEVLGLRVEVLVVPLSALWQMGIWQKGWTPNLSHPNPGPRADGSP